MQKRTVRIGKQRLAIETLLRRLRAYESGTMTNHGIETWTEKHIREIKAAIAPNSRRKLTVTIGGQTLAVDTLKDYLKRYHAGTLTPPGKNTWLKKNLPEIKDKLGAT
jgi:hypothetical protein